MFFVISKLCLTFIDPGNFLVLLVAAGLILWASGWRTAGFRMLAVAGVALVALAIFPVGDWLLSPLENRFAKPPLPARVDGILVLGGGLDSAIALTRSSAPDSESDARLIAAAALARKYPLSPVVFSGGSGALFGHELPESIAAKAVLRDLGVERQLRLESASRDTYENLVFSRKFVRPRPGDVWILATSASALPRAVGVARRLGWQMIPWPTDYLTPKYGLPFVRVGLTGNLRNLNIAIHEWLGLVAYRVTGRTSELYPGP